MSIDINNTNSVVDGYDIENGLLGIERDTFLLLLRHMGFENTYNKTRNVRNIFFFNIFLFQTDVLILYDVIYLDDRDMFREFCLDYSLSFHHIKNKTKIKS
jgi:hypothetical protein